MPSDRTRTSDDLRQNYTRPVMQQGRVVLDRDFNSLHETLAGQIENDAVDIIGPCGTPDDGFAISLPSTSPPSDDFDFLIKAGTMYVGGQRAVFPATDSAGQAHTYSYFHQPDWCKPDSPTGSPSTSPGKETISLRVFEQEVSAVEDPDLKDVALGGPDTTQRIRLMRRVERIAGATCSAAADEWAKRGFVLDPKTRQLLPQADLKVGFTQLLTTTDPCDPVVKGGYLGADNQLIRVQVASIGGKLKLLWSFDNASFIYRVTASASAPDTLNLKQTPVDAFHWPKTGQTVEVLRTAVILETDPDKTPSNPQGYIQRCVAENSGQIATLKTGYSQDTGAVILDQNLNSDILSDLNKNRPVFLRIWQAALDLPAAGGTIELTDNQQQPVTGIQVTISVRPINSKPGTIPVGAFWIFAVRPSTPQAVYPERFLIAPQSPDGPRQWLCPLAVIDWTALDSSSPPQSPPQTQAAVHDCREKFDNLVELTKRNGCCSVRLRPEDLLDNPVALQAAADRFVDNAHGVAICLMPGTYFLGEPLRLDARHSGLTIEGCHGGVTLRASPKVDAKNFLDGLMVFSGANGITLERLRLLAPAVKLADVVARSGGNLASLGPQLGAPSAMVGIRVRDCLLLTITNCEVNLSTPVDTSIFAVAILASGDCAALTIEKSRFCGPLRPRPVTIIVPRTGPSLTEVLVAKAPSIAAAGPTGAAPTAAAAAAPAVGAGSSANLAAPAETVVRSSTLFFFSAGFMMVPSVAGASGSEPKLLSFPVLKNAAFRENLFSRFTVAVLSAANTGVVRFQDNAITDCFGGLWLDALGMGNIESAERVLGLFSTADFGHITQAIEVATLYPLPGEDLDPSSGQTTGRLHRPSKGRMLTVLPQKFHGSSMASIQNTSLLPRLYIMNNQIDALPADETPSSFAVLLLAQPPASAEKGASGVVGGSSVVMNGNELRNRSVAPLGYTAAIIGANSNSITGNIFLNLFPPPDNTGKLPLSLGVFPFENPAMAVAGNVFNCRSSVGIVDRTDIQSFAASPPTGQLNRWKYCNSEPLPPSPA